MKKAQTLNSTGLDFRGLLPASLTVILLAAYLLRGEWLPLAVNMFPERISAFYLLNNILKASLLVFGCWTLLILLERVVWRGIFQKRTGRAVPRLLKDLVTVLVLTLTLMALVVVLFDQSVLTVTLFIGGLGLLVAFLFREMLQDILAGIAVNLDSTLVIGDVIELPGGLVGRLTEISWRASTLVADDSSRIVVPNRTVSNSVVINYSNDQTVRQLQVTVVMDFSVSVERVVRVFEGALRSLIAQELILSSPTACAFASTPTTDGNEYIVSFYFDSNTMREEVARTAVVAELMRHLQSTGLSPGLPRQNLSVAEARDRNMEWHNPAHREKLLARFSIFNGLEVHELCELAASVVLHDVEQGKKIITQGDTGTSMFGLAEGFLEVEITLDNQEIIKVGPIVPGEVFGEMSMLADEPRTATVTAAVDSVAFEITREAFSKIVAKRPETAVKVSRVIAERLLTAQRIEASAAEAAERESAIGETAENLFSRMKSVFTSLGLK